MAYRGSRQLALDLVQREGHVLKWQLDGEDAEERAVEYLLLLQEAQGVVVCVHGSYTHDGEAWGIITLLHRGVHALAHGSVRMARGVSVLHGVPGVLLGGHVPGGRAWYAC